jgi:hypothetical protein
MVAPGSHGNGRDSSLQGVAAFGITAFPSCCSAAAVCAALDARHESLSGDHGAFAVGVRYGFYELKPLQ